MLTRVCVCVCVWWQVLSVIAELMGTEASVELAQELLATSSLSAQQAGLKLAKEIRRGDSGMFNDLPQQFLSDMQTRFGGSGEDLVKQLHKAQVVNKRPMVEALEELDDMMMQLQDKARVWETWGRLGLRCMCTDDERTRDIGINMLEALNRRQDSLNRGKYVRHANLTEPAEAVLDWLSEVVSGEGKELIDSVYTYTLTEAERIVKYLNILYQVALSLALSLPLALSHTTSTTLPLALSLAQLSLTYTHKQSLFLLLIPALKHSRSVPLPVAVSDPGRDRVRAQGRGTRALAHDQPQVPALRGEVSHERDGLHHAAGGRAPHPCD